VKGKKVEGFTAGKWEIPEGIKTKYLGFHRTEGSIVFGYLIGKTEIYEWVEGKGELTYHRFIQGKLPEGVVFTGNDFIRESSISDLIELLQPAKAQWSKKKVITKGKLGKALPHSPYVIDTLTVPYRDLNPFKTPMRIGGVGVFSDDRIAVCTIMGDVWLVDGVDDTLDKLVWKRFASGLNQPLGLVVSDDQIHVIGRDQLTRLHDMNQDGEADFYECLTNEFPTARGNSFALTLHQDDKGRF